MSNNNYVDNDKFTNALIEWKKEVDHKRELFEKQNKVYTREDHPRMSEYIGSCIIAIVNGMASRPNFSGYSYIDEMKSQAVYNCVSYIHNFKQDTKENVNSNAFSYVSQIVSQAFVFVINREKKQQYYKEKSYQKFDINNSITEDCDNKVAQYEELMKIKSKIAKEKLLLKGSKYTPKMKNNIVDILENIKRD